MKKCKYDTGTMCEMPTLNCIHKSWTIRWNNYCAPKPKPRKAVRREAVKVFKAWTTRGKNGKPYGIIHKNPTKIDVYAPSDWFPCLIVVDQKYLKGDSK